MNAKIYQRNHLSDYTNLLNTLLIRKSAWQNIVESAGSHYWNWRWIECHKENNSEDTGRQFGGLIKMINQHIHEIRVNIRNTSINGIQRLSHWRKCPRNLRNGRNNKRRRLLVCLSKDVRVGLKAGKRSILLVGSCLLSYLILWPLNWFVPAVEAYKPTEEW